jgi:DMSO/TMAO reductase YedYZ heme-binding membrane subunit
MIAYFAWPLATAHYVLAGTDAMAEWSIALVVAVSVTLVFLLLARGFVPPVARKPRPLPPVEEVATKQLAAVGAP